MITNSILKNQYNEIANCNSVYRHGQTNFNGKFKIKISLFYYNSINNKKYIIIILFLEHNYKLKKKKK